MQPDGHGLTEFITLLIEIIVLFAVCIHKSQCNVFKPGNISQNERIYEDNLK